jgi:hypothetical protein
MSVCWHGGAIVRECDDQIESVRLVDLHVQPDSNDRQAIARARGTLWRRDLLFLAGAAVATATVMLGMDALAVVVRLLQ